MSKAYLASFVSKVSKNPFLVLDTETTGTSSKDEIVQIGIINSEGETLLDSLVKPTKSIPLAATRIHKISNEMVANAPTWAEVASQVAGIIAGETVVIYNSQFDVRMLYASDNYRDDKFSWGWDELANQYLCAMKAFAAHNKEWNSYRKSYAWKPLSVAAQKLKVPVQDAHSALGDCLMTLGVVRGLIAAHGKG